VSAISYKAKYVFITTLETPDLGKCAAELRPMRKKQLEMEKIGPKVEKMDKEADVNASGRCEDAYRQ